MTGRHSQACVHTRLQAGRCTCVGALQAPPACQLAGKTCSPTVPHQPSRVLRFWHACVGFLARGAKLTKVEIRNLQGLGAWQACRLSFGRDSCQGPSGDAA